ncbi:DUF317 domain-containing protein [Kitasatospora sp. NPDC058190]|uniref:DUF317 domain-containing protein n=1 Tax=Kitasatospora sp. NPDC058190 TaxID=3346371 RepID=UPI0036DA4113
MASDTPGADAVQRVDAAKALAVSPAYLAGEDRSAGAHVSRLLELDFDWSVRRLGIANFILDSPCRRARIGYLPTRDDYTPLWIVNVAKGPMHPALWRMAFEHGAPSELVAALAQPLAVALAGGATISKDNDAPDLIVAPLRQAGWQKRLPAPPADLPKTEILGFVSPDGLAAVQRHTIQQDEEDGLRRGSAWEITTGPPGARWTATFSSAVPDHLVAAATRWLASPQPVFRDKRELAPESLEHLRITSRSTRPRDDGHRHPQG